jgi:hypothetical protein
MKPWIALLALVACAGSPKQVDVPKKAGGGEAQVSPEIYAEISDYFNKKRPLVVTCYNNAITNRKLDAKATGRVGFTMQITPDGKIENLHVADNTLNSSDVSVCLQDMIRKWILPAPGQTTEFAYAYEFRPD